MAKPLPHALRAYIAEHFTMGDDAEDAVDQPSLHALMI